MHFTGTGVVNTTHTAIENLNGGAGTLLSWTYGNIGLDQAAEDNLPIADRLVSDLFSDLFGDLGDSGAPPRKLMAGRFNTVARHIGAGSRCRITVDMVLRASSTTWAYKATFCSDSIEFAELEVSGVL